MRDNMRGVARAAKHGCGSARASGLIRLIGQIGLIRQIGPICLIRLLAGFR